MKKVILLIILSFCINGYAQDCYEVCSWQVETRQGGLLFGISDTKDGADVVMNNFQELNRGSIHDISDHAVKYKFTIYPANKVDDPVIIFQNYAAKSSTVLSGEVVKLTEIDKKTGIDLSFDFYLKVRDDDRDFVRELSGDQTYAKNNPNFNNSEYSHSNEKNPPTPEVEYSYSSKKPSSTPKVEYSYSNKKSPPTPEVEYSYSNKKSSPSTEVKPSSDQKEIEYSNIQNKKNLISNSEKVYEETKNYYNEEGSQSGIQVVLWEVMTRSEGLLFGISNTKDQADVVMDNFQKRNIGTKYDISDYPAKYKMTSNLSSISVDNFKKLTSKCYKVISVDDIKSLQLIRSKGFDTGVDYYMDVRGADREFVTKRLSYIYNGFEKYRILPQSTKYLVINK